MKFFFFKLRTWLAFTDVKPLLLQRRGLTSLTSDKGKPVFCLILVQFVPENTVRKSINKCITLSSHKTTHSHFIYTYTETINSSEKRIRSVSLFFHRVPYKQTLSWSQRSRSCLNFSDTMFNFMHYLLKKNVFAVSSSNTITETCSWLWIWITVSSRVLVFSIVHPKVSILENIQWEENISS